MLDNMKAQEMKTDKVIKEIDVVGIDSENVEV